MTPKEDTAMSYTYEQRTSSREQSRQEPERAAESGPLLNVVTAGQAPPTGGGSPNLEAVMRERMHSTFGDISAVREVMNRTPEASVRETAAPAPYTGPVTHTLSDAAPSPAAAGPMQAKRRDADAQNVKDMQKTGENFNNVYATPDYEDYDDLDEDEWVTKTHTPGFSWLWGKKKQTYKVRRSNMGSKIGLTTDESKIDRTKDLTWDPEGEGERTAVNKYRKGMAKLENELKEKYGNEDVYENAFFQNLNRPAKPREKEGGNIRGLAMNRLFPELATDRGRGFNMSKKEITEFFDGLMAPHKKNMNDKEKLEAYEKFDKSMRKYKDILYGDMQHMEKTYGTLLSQMHPEDVAPQMGSGNEFRNHFRFTQDSAQLLEDGSRYFDFQNNEADQDFKDLDQYYGSALNYHYSYQYAVHNPVHNNPEDADSYYSPVDVINAMEEMPDIEKMKEVEDKINGPRMSPKRHQKYLEDVRKRAKKTDYMKGRLFGQFKGDELDTARIEKEKEEDDDLFE